MNLALNNIRRREQGASYVEILTATVLLTISLVPASEALRDAANGSAIYANYSAQHYQVMAKLEEVLAVSFSSLETEAIVVGSQSTATTFSDPVATPNRRLVFLSQYDVDDADGDGNPFTGMESGVVWVRVEIENTVQSLESLTVP